MADPIASSSSSVGSALTRKVGPLPVWTYAVIAGVVLFAARAHVGGLPTLGGLLGGGSGGASGEGPGGGPGGGPPDPAAAAAPGAFSPPPPEVTPAPLPIAAPRSSPPTTFATTSSPAVAGPQAAPPVVTRPSTTSLVEAPRTTSSGYRLAAILSPDVTPTPAPAPRPAPIVASPRSVAAPVTVDPVRAALGTLPLTPAQQAALGVAPLSREAREAIGTAPLTSAQQDALGVRPLTGAAAAAAGFPAKIDLNALGPIRISSSGLISPRAIAAPATPIVTNVDPSGTPFDPSIHNVTVSPDPNLEPPGTVTPVRGPR